MSLYAALRHLRAHPHDPHAMRAWLGAAYPHIQRRARRLPRADDIAQDAVMRIAERWDTCRATCEGEVVSWVRRVTWRRGMDLLRAGPLTALSEDEEPAGPAWIDQPYLVLAMGRAFERAREPWSLPPDLRARAVHHKVASSLQGRQRDVHVFFERAWQERSGTDIASERLLTRGAVFKAAARGRAAVGIGAALLARDEPDPLLRSALLEIAELAAPPIARKAA